MVRNGRRTAVAAAGATRAVAVSIGGVNGAPVMRSVAIAAAARGLVAGAIGTPLPSRLVVADISRRCEIDAVKSILQPRGGSGRILGGRLVAHGRTGGGRAGGGASRVPW